MFYMAVTADKYELPLCVENSIQMLAAKCGKSNSSVESAISKGISGTTSGVKFIKVEEEVNEEYD